MCCADVTRCFVFSAFSIFTGFRAANETNIANLEFPDAFYLVSPSRFECAKPSWLIVEYNKRQIPRNKEDTTGYIPYDSITLSRFCFISSAVLYHSLFLLIYELNWIECIQLNDWDVRRRLSSLKLKSFRSCYPGFDSLAQPAETRCDEVPVSHRAIEITSMLFSP